MMTMQHWYRYNANCYKSLSTLQEYTPNHQKPLSQLLSTGDCRVSVPMSFITIRFHSHQHYCFCNAVVAVYSYHSLQHQISWSRMVVSPPRISSVVCWIPSDNVINRIHDNSR